MKISARMSEWERKAGKDGKRELKRDVKWERARQKMPSNTFEGDAKSKRYVRH